MDKRVELKKLLVEIVWNAFKETSEILFFYQMNYTWWNL